MSQGLEVIEIIPHTGTSSYIWPYPYDSIQYPYRYGYPYFPTFANFIVTSTGTSTSKLLEILLETGVKAMTFDAGASAFALRS